MLVDRPYGAIKFKRDGGAMACREVRTTSNGGYQLLLDVLEEKSQCNREVTANL